MTSKSDIIGAIESVAPLSLQEPWDNSGIQVGSPQGECTGAVVCVDVTEQVIDRAIAAGANLVLSHHPLIFKDLKCITPATPQGRIIISAIRAGVTVYSAHTSLDNAPAPWGVSHRMGAMLGLTDVAVLTPSGTGVIGSMPAPLSAAKFVERVKSAFGLSELRCSALPDSPVSRVALVGGAGGSFITDAIAAGADAIVTGDIRHHDYVDLADRIFMLDITHFASESCTKEILMSVVSEKFPNFAACISGNDRNPINII